MILPLRQLHRRAILAMGIFLPVALATGLWLRVPVPTMSGLPPGLGQGLARQATNQTDWCCTNLFQKFSITVRLFLERTPVPRALLSFSADRDFLQPDLLVYWLPGSPVVMDALPDNATLLGEFHSPTLLLPTEAASRPGVFVLYSLADNKIVDASRPAMVGELNP